MAELVVGPHSQAGALRTPLDEGGAARVRVADFGAKVRAAGQEWTGGELVELLTQAAVGDPRLAAIVRTGGRLLQDFLDGYQQKSVTDVPRDLASELVDDRVLPHDVLAGLASRHLIVVVRLSAPAHEADLLSTVAGPDALVIYRHDLVVPPIPVRSQDNVELVVTRLTQCLDGRGWLATAERDPLGIANRFGEACEVLRLVVAGRRPSGAYTIADVLVEYAATRNERVRSNLVAVIGPLRGYPVLWETPTAFIDAGYSRKRAARSLFIHRSTLDYRLRRIGTVTGCDSITGRGVQLLTAAMIVEAVQAGTRLELITWITWQDGSHLAEHLLKQGYEVWGPSQPDQLTQNELHPLTFTPKAGAQCGSSARWDLYGAARKGGPYHDRHYREWLTARFTRRYTCVPNGDTPRWRVEALARTRPRDPHPKAAPAPDLRGEAFSRHQ